MTNFVVNQHNSEKCGKVLKLICIKNLKLLRSWDTGNIQASFYKVSLLFFWSSKDGESYRFLYTH